MPKPKSKTEEKPMASRLDRFVENWPNQLAFSLRVMLKEYKEGGEGARSKKEILRAISEQVDQALDSIDLAEGRVWSKKRK